MSARPGGSPGDHTLFGPVLPPARENARGEHAGDRTKLTIVPLASVSEHSALLDPLEDDLVLDAPGHESLTTWVAPVRVRPVAEEGRARRGRLVHETVVDDSVVVAARLSRPVEG